HSPVQASAQHFPFLQAPDWHSIPSAQSAPEPFLAQAPPWQVRPWLQAAPFGLALHIHAVPALHSMHSPVQLLSPQHLPAVSIQFPQAQSPSPVQVAPARWGAVTHLGAEHGLAAHIVPAAQLADMATQEPAALQRNRLMAPPSHVSVPHTAVPSPFLRAQPPLPSQPSE